jgi:hypothetical protein
MGVFVRLDDVLKDCRSAQHSSYAGRAPGPLAICAHDRVEAGQVLVETEHVRDRLGERGVVGQPRRAT